MDDGEGCVCKNNRDVTVHSDQSVQEKSGDDGPVKSDTVMNKERQMWLEEADNDSNEKPGFDSGFRSGPTPKRGGLWLARSSGVLLQEHVRGRVSSSLSDTAVACFSQQGEENNSVRALTGSEHVLKKTSQSMSAFDALAGDWPILGALEERTYGSLAKMAVLMVSVDLVIVIDSDDEVGMEKQLEAVGDLPANQAGGVAISAHQLVPS
ncbi:hypothetical protein NDU88_000101 [Pleurodeles waltl]|uniref:Uncharacterized protein n=1 Tax=Pleurodeles waltl TaxID=8319 RepID=A0AAV7VVU8_PLEWA|nr:hypothetical protein NDU88_000101 [Pleurodeles waltl]